MYIYAGLTELSFTPLASSMWLSTLPSFCRDLYCTYSVTGLYAHLRLPFIVVPFSRQASPTKYPVHSILQPSNQPRRPRRQLVSCTSPLKMWKERNVMRLGPITRPWYILDDLAGPGRAIQQIRCSQSVHCRFERPRDQPFPLRQPGR